MLKIYGSMQCPDCVACKKELDAAGVSYEYFDFSDNLMYLKEFLSIRDSEPLFEEVRRQGKIGIPCIVDEKGNIFLDWEHYVSQDKA